MSAATWVLIWVGATSPTLAEQRALQDYAETRMIRLVPPSELPAPARPPSEQTAARVEQALTEARVLSSSLEHTAALEELTRAKELLLSAPHLPQAPWLMAECLRVEALARAAASPKVAATLWQEAALLDGGRPPAVGETIELGPQAEGDDQPARRITLRYDGQDQVFINGRLAPPPHRARVGAGPLHVRIAQDGREIWSAWLPVTKGAKRLELPSRSAPCAPAVFDSARQMPDQRAVAAGVSCPRWVLARSAPGPTARRAGADVSGANPSARGPSAGGALQGAVSRPAGGLGAEGAVQLRSCEGSWCGGWVHWRASSRRVFIPSAVPLEARGWPSWATYVLVGVGAVAATSFTLWRAGAFDAPAAGKRGWVYQPPNAASF